MRKMILLLLAGLLGVVLAAGQVTEQPPPRQQPSQAQTRPQVPPQQANQPATQNGVRIGSPWLWVGFGALVVLLMIMTGYGPRFRSRIRRVERTERRDASHHDDLRRVG